MDNKTLYAAHAARICNRPLLINPAYLPVLSRSLELLAMGTDLKSVPKLVIFPDAFGAVKTEAKFDLQDGAAIIRVYGFLSYRTEESWFFDDGGTSYEDIREQFQAALVDPAVKSIVLDINSPGGEAAGVFDLVDEIYHARGQKPIHAVFNEDGFSAAFAIASAADKRYISRTGAAGSVGVVAMHLDQSGWDANAGLVFTPIYAGAHKVDYSSHAPLSPEAKSALQGDIDAVYAIFVSTVARNLGLTEAAIKATEAGIFQGKKAVELGFADAVMPWNKVMTKLTNRKNGGVMKAELEKLFGEMRDKFLALIGSDPAEAVKQEVVTKADAELLVVAAEEAAKKDGHAAGLVEGAEAGRAEAQARAIEIMEICALAGMEKDALGYIKDTALSAENVRLKVVEAQAAEAEQTRIRSTVSATTTGEPNPLMDDAKKRAAAGISLVKK